MVLNDNTWELVDKVKISKDIFINGILEEIKEENTKIFIEIFNIILDNINSFST